MYQKSMKIGVLGSGAVGQVLASAFLQEGNSVMLGTRNVSKPEVLAWKEKNSAAETGSFAETAAFGELIVLAVEGGVAEEVLRQAGAGNLDGKTVIDATNPISKEPPENGVLKFFTDMNFSLMEKLQQQFPSVHFVKAFNSVGNYSMYKPDFGGIKPTMFICGNDDEARQTVSSILTAFGWETEDMGKAEAARAIEPLAMLWCIPGFIQNRWNHAFKILKP